MEDDLQSIRIGVATATFQTIAGYPLETIKTRLQAPLPTQRILHNLYSGCASPFMAQLCIHPVFFTVYYWLRNDGMSPAMAGAGSGLLSGIMTNPIEVRKTRLQAGRSMLSGETGWWRAGMTATCSRDMIGSAIYWHVFEGMMQDSPNWWAGGCAGVSSWVLSYPLDIWKTRCQTSSTNISNNLILGLGVTVVRAFIVNSGILTIYASMRQAQ